MDEAAAPLVDNNGMEIDEQSAVDENSQQAFNVFPKRDANSPPCSTLPYYGTKVYKNMIQATKVPPKNLDELFAEYKNFKMLKKKDDMNSNCDAGTPAYLVSQKWLTKYLDFLLFEQFSAGASEHQLKYDKDNHFTKAHPGPITNQEIIEDDKDQLNLYGTGNLKGFNQEYIDQYLDTNLHQQQHYQIYNEELWAFLVQRYGGNPIKRFYIRSGSMFYTNVEQKLKALQVRFLNS